MINQNLLLTGDDGYNLTNSLRFRSSASAYLNRTPASAGNRRTYTWSGWVKRGILSSGERTLFNAGGTLSDTGFLGIRFTSDDKLDVTTGSTDLRQTTQVFRDPSAWYHIVVAMDTTQATGSNRVKVYLNGTQITAFSTSNDPSLNLDTAINNTVGHAIGLTSWNSAGLFDGYMTEVNFIDGQALTPSSFGETSASTGVWIPKKYSGTSGTNGFYLDFKDNSSTAALGYDAAGSNDWTVNNISLTSGSTYDSMTDVPTLAELSGNGNSNYCVFNPLDKGSTNFTFSNGNLTVSGASASSSARATMAVSSGKWYWEATPTAIGNGLGVGFAGDSSRFNPVNWNSGTYVIYQSDGNKHINGSASSYGSSYTTNDVIGVALDMDGGTITFYKNNVSQGTASTGLTGVYLPVFSQTSGATTGTINSNFGAGSGFTYAPPTGFKALNTFNLPTPTIGATASTQANDYFNVVTYTGNGATYPSTQSITGVGFQPDFTWIKSRSNAYPNFAFDAVRGAGKELVTNDTAAETNKNQLSAFGSDGFSVAVATDGSLGTNGNGSTFVAWNWKANGSGSTNTAGTITSTVSANTSAGFSIVTYTGSGAAGTVGHGLGVAPSMIITKKRSNAGGGSAATNWVAWHKSLSGAYNSTTGYIYFNDTATGATTTNFYDGTAMTSTTFRWQTGNDNINYSNDTYVAYCFAEVAGYSAFGSYTGNGSTDGPFVFTGFRPRFVMIKRTDNVGNWYMLDTSRDTYNLVTQKLMADLSAAENGNGESTSTNTLDILSNGFKMRSTNTATNQSSGTFVYMAFAENPFKYSLAR